MAADAGCESSVGLGFWNMLADGMTRNEFATWGGDGMLAWHQRSTKIVEVLAEGLSKCDVFAVAECDRAVHLYQSLLPVMPDLRALWVIGAQAEAPPAPAAPKVQGVSNARAIALSRALVVAAAAGCTTLPTPLPSIKQLLELPAPAISAIVHSLSLAAASNSSLVDALVANGLHAQTWLQEAGGNQELAALVAAAYGAATSDLAFSDDGICVFWRDSRVQLMRSSLSSLPLQLPLPAFAIAVQKRAAVFCCWCKGGFKFITAAAHFPSGESSEDFSRRHLYTQQLCTDWASFCSGIMPPPHGILLCDSNESPEYETQFLAEGGSPELTLSHALSLRGLFDVASSDKNARCLKLRHARGAQASKLGSLMFDRIDRIVMHPRLAAHASMVPLQSFVRYPTAISDEVAAVRCDAAARSSLREWVKQSNLGPDTSQTPLPDKFSFLRHLYPSLNAPSDHPPLAVSLSLSFNMFASAAEVLRYWFGSLYYSPQVHQSHDSPPLQPPSPPLDSVKERMGYWFSRASPSFDEAQQMSVDTVRAAAAGMLSGREWEGPEGALAKLILLDQFPRCIFRGTRFAFQFDPAVLQLVQTMKSRGWLRLYDAVQLFFVGVAAQHSESSAAQQLGLEIAGSVLQCNSLDLREYFKSLKGYPHEHADVISKFGRFPGRNAATGRRSTPEELQWLADPSCPAWCKSQAAADSSTDAPPPPHLDYPHVLQACLQAVPDNASDVVAQATAAAEAGLFCEAEQLFIRALTREDSAATREMCAQVAMENDCAAAAIVHATKAAAMQPTWPSAYVTLGRACRNAGELGRASAAFTTALSLLSPNDLQAAEVELEQREVLQLLQQLQQRSRGEDRN